MTVEVECARGLFTVDEYMRMGEVGILGEDERSEKAALYAEVGVPEYWVADGVGEAIEAHHDPDGQRYRQSTRLTGSGSVSPLAFPDIAVRLPDIFG